MWRARPWFDPLPESRADRGVATCRTLSITLEAGKIVCDVDGRGKQALIAMSESEFTALYGLGVQFIDGGLYVKHVSGNYRFTRK